MDAGRRPRTLLALLTLACGAGFAGTGCVAPRPIPAVSSAALPLVEPRMRAYRVVRGDTWYGIARRNGVGLEALMEANGRAWGTGPILRAGELIRIPGPEPAFRSIHTTP